MRIIVKVQTPLFPQDAPALVYNQDRSVMMKCPMDDSLKKIMGGKAKAYFKAEVVGDKINLLKQLPDQNW